MCGDGLVYLQVSRGARPRDFLFPPEHVKPTVVCLARSVSPARLEAAPQAGIAIKTMPDTRWARCDIKTVMLLPASLAKEAARGEGAKEAWFVDERRPCHRGASSNAWIVDREGRLITRQIDNAILRGVTRTTLIDLLKRENIELVERPFTRGGGQGRARGLHYLGDQLRHAGGAHRRKAHRQWRAGAAVAKAAGRISFRGRNCRPDAH